MVWGRQSGRAAVRAIGRFDFRTACLVSAIGICCGAWQPLTAQHTEMQCGSGKEWRLSSGVKVLANNGAEHISKPAGTLAVEKAGRYAVQAKVFYNSGDAQRNESFFLQVVHASGDTNNPFRPNAGDHYLVADMPGDAQHTWKDAGEFLLDAGENTIVANHYALIADKYPEYLDGPITGFESVSIDSLRLVYMPRTDGEVALTAETPSTLSVSGVDTPLLRADEEVQYTLRVANLQPDLLYDGTLTLLLPDGLQFSAAAPPATELSGSTIVWTLPPVGNGADLEFMVSAGLADDLPAGHTRLRALAILAAGIDCNRGNNLDSALVYGQIDTTRSVWERDKSADVVVSLRAESDTSGFDAEGQPTKLVRQGGSVRVAATLFNAGPDTAHGINFALGFPGGTIPSEFNRRPDLQDYNRLVLFPAPLLPGDGISLAYRLRVPADWPETGRYLQLSARGSAVNDSLPENNAAFDSVFVLAPDPEPVADFDLQLQMMARFDTSETTSAAPDSVRAGDQVYFVLHVENTGPDAAADVRVQNVLPGTLASALHRPSPKASASDTLAWSFDAIESGDAVKILYQATVSHSLPRLPFYIINKATVSALGDRDSTNNAAQAGFWVRGPSFLPQETDVSVWQTTYTDSFSVAGDDTTQFARANELFQRDIIVRNTSDLAARNVRLVNYFDDLTRIDNIWPPPTAIVADSMVWQLGTLPAFSRIRISYRQQTTADFGQNSGALISRCVVSAPDELPHWLFNNTNVDTVRPYPRSIQPAAPVIEAHPARITIGDSVSLRVYFPRRVLSYDVWAYLADGSIDSTFLDSYIERTFVRPEIWYPINAAFRDVRLYTGARVEELVFELRATDTHGIFTTSRAGVTVNSANAMLLERNVFNPQDTPLGIRFKLSSNRVARLDLFNLAGKQITKLAERRFDAGWNVYYWNGSSTDGTPVASGVYLVTLQSGEFYSWKKFIIVR